MTEIKPKKPIGVVDIPASNSQTIRALLIAAFARGESVIRHPLLSSDTISCMNAIRQLGASLSLSEDGSVLQIDSRRFAEGTDEIEIDAGNSGTTEYLLMAMAASLDRPIRIIGDEQLTARPVGPLEASLKDLGATIMTDNGKPPIYIKGPLKGGRTLIECKTSQYLSALLLGTPMAPAHDALWGAAQMAFELLK